MEALGWDVCDVILVTGDAYVDHPSFGMAIIGRLLEAQGFRVGIIAQPDWQDAPAFKALGKPNLFFGVTARQHGFHGQPLHRRTGGCATTTAIRPTARAASGPTAPSIVYAQRCREAFRDVPIVLGGIEASLRRIAHYDYWSDKVRRSVLADAKADMLLYGNAERAVVEIAHRLAAGGMAPDIADIRGTAVMVARARRLDARWIGSRSTMLDAAEKPSGSNGEHRHPPAGVRAGRADRDAYAHASRVPHRESNPGNARAAGPAPWRPRTCG